MRLLIFMMVTLFALPTFAQKKDKKKRTEEEVPVSNSSPSSSKEYKQQKAVFDQALIYADYSVAKNALYQMMAIDTANKNLRDTLCILYFHAGDYGHCVMLGDQILKENPENVDIRGLKAISEKALGLLKEALSDYEVLYNTNQSLEYLYQICTIQYEMKRYGECILSADKIIADSQSENVKINISTQQSRQMIPMKAAAINIKGVIFLEMGKKDEARNAFKQALALAPDFELAKNNLKVLNEKK